MNAINEVEAVRILADVVAGYVAVEEATTKLTYAQVRLTEWTDDTLPEETRERIVDMLNNARAPLYEQEATIRMIALTLGGAIGEGVDV